MTEYLTLEDLVVTACRFLGTEPVVRDAGLLESAVARPASTVFGQDAYPAPDGKAAALLHSLVKNHALVDGNKRLGWTAVNLFYGYNGYELVADEDAAYEFILAVAGGDVDDIADIAKVLHSWAKAHRWR